MVDYRLLELKVEVNRHCPLRCLHCSSNGMPHAPERLDTIRVVDLIQEFAFLGGQKLSISGGEPLCYKSLRQILDACHASGVETGLYTTGICSNGDNSLRSISKEMVSMLLEYNVKVTFSLHGAIKKVHEILTQTEGSFNTTMRSMEQALAAGLKVEVHVVPTAINFSEIADIVALLVSVGVKRVSWLRFVPQGRGLLNKHVLQLNREQLRQLAREKLQIQQMYPTINIRTGSPFNILCPEVPSSCEAGISVLTIGPDGAVSPCDALKRFRFRDDLSNILHQTLSEVWHRSCILNAVRVIQESKLSSLCSSCASYSKCKSGCLAQKAIATGAITDGKDPDCLLDYTKVVRDEIKEIAVC